MPSGLLFFRVRFASFQLTPLYLPSSYVSLSHFILAVPMRHRLGKYSCMSSTFPIAILNGKFFFSRGEIVLALAEASPIKI